MRFGNVRWVFAMIVAMTLPWFLVGEPVWGWTFVGIALVVGIGELVSIKRHGITLSERFWRRFDDEPEKGLFVIIGLAAAMLILVLHLLLP